MTPFRFLFSCLRRYAHIGAWWKRAACLGLGALLLPLVNPVLDRLTLLAGGEVGRVHGFWFQPDFTCWREGWYYNENVLFLTWLCLAAAAALCAALALRRGGRAGAAL